MMAFDKASCPVRRVTGRGSSVVRCRWYREMQRSTNTFTAKSEVFTAIKIQVAVFWVVAPRSDVVGYRRFGGPCFFYLQGAVNGAGNTTQRNEQLYV
jgi:uncharacterized protein YodC (DUF2158 family)